LVSRLDAAIAELVPSVTIGKVTLPCDYAANEVTIKGNLDDLSTVFMGVVTGLVDEINNGDRNA
jgi:hypothetical protein